MTPISYDSEVWVLRTTNKIYHKTKFLGSVMGYMRPDMMRNAQKRYELNTMASVEGRVSLNFC